MLAILTHAFQPFLPLLPPLEDEQELELSTGDEYCKVGCV